MARPTALHAALIAAYAFAGLSMIVGMTAAFPRTEARAAESGFVSGIDDLPLMPGLAPVDDAGLVFDKPGGRIVEAVAVGRVGTDEVLSFYARIAPQLGWRPEAEGRFVREGEVLQLFVSGSPELTTVRFTLLPR